jgi:hypothetical protein
MNKKQQRCETDRLAVGYKTTEAKTLRQAGRRPASSKTKNRASSTASQAASPGSQNNDRDRPR